MGNELIRPIDQDTAKAIAEAAQLGGKLVDAGSGIGRYTAGVFGTLPYNLIGIASDYVEHKRRIRALELDREYKELLRERGVDTPKEPSPSVAIPILEAAVDEDREVLRDLWARLLANAWDPERADRVRVSLVQLLKRFDPFDAVVLQALGAASGAPAPNPRDYVIASTKRSEDEVMVSFENLIELGCLAKPATGELWKPMVTWRGRLLLLAVSR